MWIWSNSSFLFSNSVNSLKHLREKAICAFNFKTYIRTVDLNFYQLQNYPKGLVQIHIAGPHPRVSESVVCVRASDFGFLTSFRGCRYWWSGDNTLRTTEFEKTNYNKKQSIISWGHYRQKRCFLLSVTWKIC